MEYIRMDEISEFVKKSPLIISYRPPCEDDVYEVGTKWEADDETFLAIKAIITWVKIEKDE